MTARPKHEGTGVEVFDMIVGGEELVVISMPVETSGDALAALTPAEREVALAATKGLSNAAIATRRTCSSRTVANQLAAIYRKLGVSSRAELVLKVRGR